jgi:hypothetical protein
MNVGFDNILEHVIPMNEFSMKWRFTDEQYDKLPQLHLDQLKPLDRDASQFLWDFISNNRLHSDVPFKNDFFKVIDKARMFEGNDNEIKKWLYKRGLLFEKEVYLSWQPGTAMIVPWKLLIKYFNAFYYADDLTIIDQSLNWALLFFHEDVIYFGTNTKYEAVDTFDNIDFLF